MNNIVESNKFELALIHGDLSKLQPEERLSYYNKVCESLGLNPLTSPFAYIKLNGKEVLYAKRDATDQLRHVHGVSIKITGREVLGGVYVVTAQAKRADGREDESTGAVFIDGMKGEMLANAYMKAETKAKRRVTLSVCGLGLLDETEVESIPVDATQQKAPDLQMKISAALPKITPTIVDKTSSSVGLPKSQEPAPSIIKRMDPNQPATEEQMGRLEDLAIKHGFSEDEFDFIAFDMFKVDSNKLTQKMLRPLATAIENGPQIVRDKMKNSKIEVSEEFMNEDIPNF